MSKDNGGSAFPSHGTMGEVVCEGMTLRDYFAAKALMVVGASHAQEDLATWDYEHFAEFAYQMADAMLLERAK